MALYTSRTGDGSLDRRLGHRHSRKNQAIEQSARPTEHFAITWDKFTGP